VRDVISPAPGTIVAAKGKKAAGYVVSGQVNDAFRAVNRLLAAKEDVYRLGAPAAVGTATWAAGTFYVAAKPSTAAVVKKIADEVGLSVEATAVKVPAGATRMRPVRIGLWDRYGGSMPSGWTRFILEQFEFPFEVVYPQTLDAGALAAKYDVLIFVDGAIPERETAGPDPFMGGQPSTEGLPAEYRGQLGNITVAKTIPQLRQFVEDGGLLLAIGSSTAIATHFRLPVSSALVERTPRGEERALPNDRFYIPGSVLEAALDTTNPLAWGMPSKADVFFENSPAFRLGPDAALKGVKPVAWYDSAKPLRSGWAWGQAYLEDAVAVIDAAMGKGHVFLYAPEIAFRAQPHGTYKLLFNGIYYGGGGEPPAPVKK